MGQEEMFLLGKIRVLLAADVFGSVKGYFQAKLNLQKPTKLDDSGSTLRFAVRRVCEPHEEGVDGWNGGYR